MSDAIYAFGKAGAQIRAIMITDLETAQAGKQDGELLMKLDRVPNEPVMITEDGSDVIAIPETPEARAARLWKGVRATRNALLDSTRWTVANDSPLSADCQSKWLDYLKTLNRVTADYTDPMKIVWPAQPALEYATVYAKATVTPSSVTATITVTKK